MQNGEPATKRSTRPGIAVLTAFLWHLAAFVAAWLNTLVGREDTSCGRANGFCFTAKDSADLLFIVSIGFLFFSVLLSLAIAAGFARTVQPAVLAGTLAAFTSAFTVAAVIVALLVLHALF